jgi:two-component system nitrate/nitrite response regulator NarL
MSASVLHRTPSEEPSRAIGAVRVLVADDHPLMRRALARLVREHSGLELVGEAGDGEQALAMLASIVADVALLDVRMPGLDGLAVLRRLRASNSPVRVLLLSGGEEGEIAHEALSLGAAGFLSKSCEEGEMCEAILAVAAGRSVLSVALPSGLVDLIERRGGVPVRLSSRERELLMLATEGLTTGEIAERLCLSPNTVKTYWQRLYEKLGTSDRASAVAEAIRRGLLA